MRTILHLTCCNKHLVNRAGRLADRPVLRRMPMFHKLFSTSNDFVLTIVRLVLGVTFFMHGAQKMLGWFGGYGFHATMGVFTQHMGIPAPWHFWQCAPSSSAASGCWLVCSAVSPRWASWSTCWSPSPLSTT